MIPPSAVPSVISQIGKQQPLHSLQIWIKSQAGSTRGTYLSILTNLTLSQCLCMPGVVLMVRVVGLGFSDPEFKSPSAVELIAGGVDSACHPSEVGKMSWYPVLEWRPVQDCAQ